MRDPLVSARRKIDALDRRIAGLLARRWDLAVPLRALKAKAADRARERRVLANAGAAAGRRYSGSAKAVFACIIGQTKKLQAAK
ncbi:MAG: chorismate mutase [Elusimicrobia bacterium]|nr:chorismate mutase [Elusimicrobiota bacterium]